MRSGKFLIFVILLLAIMGLSWGIDQAVAQVVVPTGAAGFNSLVDYNKPNFAYSPNIRKFIDKLPGVGAPGCTVSSPPGTGTCNENNLGQYIPLAEPDTTTYPGDEFYQISAREFNMKMHSDLPVTHRLRGYVQTNAASPSSNVQQYLGPMILAKTYYHTNPPGNGKPVRVLFKNELPLGSTLPLPIDITMMGAGTGPTGAYFSQNRVTIPHLHGGNTPWISDGTPQQYITPAHETSVPQVQPYLKGLSFQNVPDMVGAPGGTCIATNASGCIAAPALNDGMGTLYWSNQQSSRLMFYHDHVYGLTRHNVYMGLAAPFLLYDQTEQDMIDGTNVSGAFTTPMQVLPNLGGVYKFGVPLVIQDKTFVNDGNTPPGQGFSGIATQPTSVVDPNWTAAHTWVGGGTPPVGGDLWWPHEYMPNQDIYDPSGANPLGRSDYGPWLNPAVIPLNANLPSPSVVPEEWGDTMVVNGTAFPYLNVPAAAVRFRILNAADDRTLNLSWFVADPAHPTEVKMVPAIPDSAFPTWPTDGRNGGVPDPTTRGPAWYQIGNEGGLLPQVAVVQPQPVGIEYSRLVPTLLNVTNHSLLIMGAMRADVVVDFSAFAGKTLILFNDAPAPMPLFDERNDQYTDDPDFTSTGGAPTTVAGFGPNTRTVMQVRVAASPVTPFNLAALQAALPQAYKATQAPPIIPQSAYNAAFNPNPQTQQQYPDTYVNNTDATVNLTGTRQGVESVVTTLGGSGFTTAPTVSFVNASPGGSGAAATAYLDGVTAITVTTAGTGYNNPPTVTIAPPDGVQATATATVVGGAVNAFTITNGGLGYDTANPPLVTIAAPPCTINGTTCVAATATVAGAGVVNTAVTAITLGVGGAGYTTAPLITIDPPVLGTQATATATQVGGVVQNTVVVTKGGGLYIAGSPAVTITDPVGTGATATATVVNGVVTAITVTNGGTGYTAPVVTVAPPPATATAVATVSGGGVTAITIVDPGFSYTAVNPPVTITPNPLDTTAVNAAATAGITLGSVAHIQLTNPGLGYTKAPYVYLTGGGGTGATADAKLIGDLVIGMKNITEGFDPWYGRINVLLGTTPVPLDPFSPAPAVPGIAAYIDPPSDFWNDGQPYIFRLAHLGVDSHAMHFHLVNLQVVNRVDYTNTLLPPEPDELGWRETIRTNPFTDLILAVTPKRMWLPFNIPNSQRLLDPSTPLGSTANYVQPAAVPGTPTPAGLSNVSTNFGWEYVWHCHLLSHEENDMMRTIVFQVPTAAPAAATNLVATITPAGPVHLTWTYNSGNESGFQVLRCSPGPCTPSATAFATVNLNLDTFDDAAVTPGTAYSYQIVAVNSVGNATPSNIATITPTVTPAGAPAVPTPFTATPSALSSNPPTVVLVWTDNSTNELGFIVERATNAAFTANLVTFPMVAANVTTYTDTTVAEGTQYWYRVRAHNLSGDSNNVTSPAIITTGQLPADPGNLVASPFTVTTAPPAVTVKLTWTDNSSNETNFRIQRATDAGFTQGLTTYLVGANVTTYTDTAVSPNIHYYYRVIALNANGASMPSNTAEVTPTILSLSSPINLVATASAAGKASAVSLTWTDTDTNATTFIIQRALDAGFTTGLATFSIGRLGNLTSYTDKTVLPLTTYFYQVIAFNVLGSSLPSNTATVTTNSGASFIYLPLILKH